MSFEWNNAIRLAQTMLTNTANRLPDRETSYKNYGPHRDKPGLLKAVTLLGDLIVPEEKP